MYDCLKGIGICNKTLINIPVYFEIKKKINNACFIDLSINLQLILPPIVQYMCLSSQHGEREITTFMNCDNAFLSKTAPRQILWRSICCT